MSVDPNSETSEIPPQRPDPPHASAARYFGYLLILVFAGLSVPSDGFFISFVAYPQHVSMGEAMLWLGHTYLLFPACCALGYGFSASIWKATRAAADRVAAMTRAEIAVGLAAAFALVVAAARILNALVLVGYPFTDDEYAAQFGGRVLATGHAMAPRLVPPGTFSELFLFKRDDLLTSFDTLGAQLPWAFDALTGLGPLLFAAAAALPFVFVPLAVGRRFGSRWGALALLFLATSPMAVTLSYTTHTHLLSRGMLSAALCLFVFARESGRGWQWALCGLAVGASFTARPFETTFLALPFAALVAYELVRGENGARRGAVLFVAGAIGPVVAFALHSWAVTGNPFLPARLVPQTAAAYVGNTTLWVRFGVNTSYNALALSIWFLGPLGVLLVPLGVARDRVTRALGASVVSVLCLGLTHADTGLHVVGPIHYSECVVPLTFLAASGAVAARDALARHGFRPDVFASCAVAACLLGLTTFTAIHAVSLHAQAKIQDEVYATIDGGIAADGGGKAVVFAPQFGALWGADPLYQVRGAWVFEWRRPFPDLRDDVLIFHAVGDLAALRAQFPDRRFYLLRSWDGQNRARLERFEPAPAQGAPSP